MMILESLPLFLAYFALASVLTAMFLGIYLKATPYSELELIKQGMVAPALSLSGALLGFVIALGSVIKNSIHLLDMLAWGVVAMIVQLLVFLAVRLLFPALTQGISQNNIAKALFLAVMSVAFGVLNAACMTY